MNGPRIASKARLKWDAHTKTHLLLYPERGLALSASASAILKLCDGAHSVDAIIEALSHSQPDEDRETIRGDVTAFLSAMRKRGLIEE